MSWGFAAKLSTRVATACKWTLWGQRRCGSCENATADSQLVWPCRVHRHMRIVNVSDHHLPVVGGRDYLLGVLVVLLV